MTPTKDNVGEFWWLVEGNDDPIVVEISLAYCHGEMVLVCYYTGWEIPYRIDTMAKRKCKWLGRAVPPDGAQRGAKCP